MSFNQALNLQIVVREITTYGTGLYMDWATKEVLRGGMNVTITVSQGLPPTFHKSNHSHTNPFAYTQKAIIRDCPDDRIACLPVATNNVHGTRPANWTLIREFMSGGLTYHDRRCEKPHLAWR